MAEAKLGWILFHLLGWPVTITAYFADIQTISLGEPYKTVMSIFGCIFIFINVLRAREKWRKDKIENDHQQWVSKGEGAN